jgi:hypothetical protein
VQNGLKELIDAGDGALLNICAISCPSARSLARATGTETDEKFFIKFGIVCLLQVTIPIFVQRDFKQVVNASDV